MPKEKVVTKIGDTRSQKSCCSSGDMIFERFGAESGTINGSIIGTDEKLIEATTKSEKITTSFSK